MTRRFVLIDDSQSPIWIGSFLLLHDHCTKKCVWHRYPNAYGQNEMHGSRPWNFCCVLMGKEIILFEKDCQWWWNMGLLYDTRWLQWNNNHYMAAYWFSQTKNFKISFFARKIGRNVFLECQRILLMEFMVQGRNNQCTTVLWNFEKCTECSTEHKAWPIQFSVVLLLDNRWEHASHMIQIILLTTIQSSPTVKT